MKKYFICNDNASEKYRVDDIPMAGIIDPGGFAETRIAKRGSRNVMVIGGQPPNSTKKFIVYIHASRIKETQPFIDEWKRANKLWRPRVWYIEITGPGQYMKKDLERVSREESLFLNILACPAENSQSAKDDRITSLIRPLEAGEIIFLDGIPGLVDFKMEYRSYPNAITVDILDAIGWLYKLWWTRQKIEDLNKINQDRLNRLIQAR